MIPKRIFYVWGANEKKPRDVLVCIQTWRQMMPDYEIIELNEDDKTYFDYEENLKANKWFRTVYQNKMWAYVADYIRIKVLYEHGGIYFDTDVSVVKSLTPLLKNQCFVGMQNTTYVEPAILAATKGNLLLKEILSFYNKDIYNEEIYTMPQIFKKYINKLCNIDGFPDKKKQKIIHTKYITIYPEKYLIPWQPAETCFDYKFIEKETYTIHWFMGSWVKPSILDFLNNKHTKKDYKIRHDLDYTNIKRYKIGKITIFRSKSNSNCDAIIELFHCPVITIKNKIVKLFSIIPILKVCK